MFSPKCGINVNEFKLFPSDKYSSYFGAKRFDGENGKQIYMISLSALSGTLHSLLNLDYYHLFKVIEKICVNKEIYTKHINACVSMYSTKIVMTMAKILRFYKMKN